MSSRRRNNRKKARGVSAPPQAGIRRKLLGDYIPEDVHDYKIDRHTFTIFVEGEETIIEAVNPESAEPGVEHNMSGRFEKNLNILSGIDSKRPILVNLSSSGGWWHEGMKMFGAILVCPNPITVLSTKDARSMTSIIPLAADRFVMRPPGKYMYHHGTYAFNGIVQEAMTDFEELLRTREIMLRIYVARLKEQGKFRRYSQERIRQMLERNVEKKIDVWLDADEAKSWGFIDEVFGGDIKNLRAQRRNEKRRKTMLDVLRRPVNIDIKVS